MKKENNINRKSYRGMRCTQATLYAFGIDGCPLHGVGVLQRINKVHDYKMLDDSIGMKLSVFIKKYADNGNYVIATANHSMALVNGELIDTAHGTGRRTIQYAFEVINYKPDGGQLHEFDERI